MRMAVTAAGACVWSGVDTTTASIFESSSWRSSRKSLYFLASLCFPAIWSSRSWSMSQMATIWPVARRVRCRSSFPADADAGDVQSLVRSEPPAQPVRPCGRMPKPATDAPNKNDRRFVEMLMSDGSSKTVRMW